MDLRETVLALFCDPEGEPCFHGSDGDRAALKAVLATERDRLLPVLELARKALNAASAYHVDVLERVKPAIDAINEVLGEHK